MPNLYTIQAIDGKGLGILADQEIKAGVRILTDEVLFSIADSTANESIENRISASFEYLSTSQKQEFETLHCPNIPTNSIWTPLVRRYMANAFEMAIGTSGIFLIASRINHSCCPNACFTWNSNLGQLTVHAMVDIPIGEEITLSYELPFLTLQQRQTRHFEHYGFICDCPACRRASRGDDHGEMRRQRRGVLYSTLQQYEDESSNAEERSVMTLELIRLATEERLDGQFLPSMYQRVSMLYEDQGNIMMALRYVVLELEGQTRLLGVNHSTTINCANALLHLRSMVVVNGDSGVQM